MSALNKYQLKLRHALRYFYEEKKGNIQYRDYNHILKITTVERICMLQR